VEQLEDKSSNAAFSLRKLYEKLLQPFDEHSQKRAEGGYGLLGEWRCSRTRDLGPPPRGSKRGAWPS
jgi:hypothetical protein